MTNEEKQEGRDFNFEKTDVGWLVDGSHIARPICPLTFDFPEPHVL